MEPLVPEVLREGKEIKDYQEGRVIMETWVQEEYQVLVLAYIHVRKLIFSCVSYVVNSLSS